MTDKPIVSIIAAIGPNRELGKDNQLLWHIKKDFKHFQTKTTGHPVIMGRKTFESIGKPLPNRTNIIVTRNKDFSKNDTHIVNDIESAIKLAKQFDQKEIFIIGGGEIYRQALPHTDKLYLTLVEGKYQADSFFPDYSEFKKQISISKQTEGDYRFSFVELARS